MNRWRKVGEMNWGGEVYLNRPESYVPTQMLAAASP